MSYYFKKGVIKGSISLDLVLWKIKLNQKSIVSSIELIQLDKLIQIDYRSGTVNSNTVNLKFNFILSFCEFFSYHFPII